MMPAAVSPGWPRRLAYVPRRARAYPRQCTASPRATAAGAGVLVEVALLDDHPVQQRLVDARIGGVVLLEDGQPVRVHRVREPPLEARAVGRRGVRAVRPGLLVCPPRCSRCCISRPRAAHYYSSCPAGGSLWFQTINLCRRSCCPKPQSASGSLGRFVRGGVGSGRIANPAAPAPDRILVTAPAEARPRPSPRRIPVAPRFPSA